MSAEHSNRVAVENEASLSEVGATEHVERVLPVLAEDVVVEKRIVETGRVRLHKTVQTHEEIIDEPLEQETVEIERIPINRVVAAPIPMRQEGDVTIISLTKEVLVVEKRLMFTEELRITRRRSEIHEPQQVTLHSEELVIERLPAVESSAS
jgi:stress response protein YsnF